MITKETFTVQGMTCASCVATVEKVLLGQKGVKSATVNLATNTAQVAFDDTESNAQSLARAVKGAGYGLIAEMDGTTSESIEIKRSNILKINVILSAILSIPVMAIGMLHMHDMTARERWISCLLATPVVWIFGSTFFKNAWRQLLHVTANMDTLVALSAGTAYLYSLFNTLFPQPAVGMNHPEVYFEASTAVVTFVLLGRLLEERAKSNTSDAIKKLLHLQPDTVVVLQPDGTEQEIAISDVKIGNQMLAKPGQKIAVDGSVTGGQSFVDESMITGEPIAIEKTVGDRLYSGSINTKGTLTYVAEKVGKDTFLAQIIAYVRQAQGSKAPVQKYVDRVAAVFVPVVLCIAVVTFSAWAFWGGEAAIGHAVRAAVTVLAIACPCALGLATPTGIMVGLGRGAESGILVKDAAALEKARDITTVVLDKTGTVTLGKPVVTGTLWLPDVDTEKIKAVLYSLEAQSEHPLAGAVTDFLKASQPNVEPVTMFSAIPGGGITGLCGGTLYFVGSDKLLKSMNIAISTALTLQANEWYATACTVIFIADFKQAFGAIAVKDAIKPSSGPAIQGLIGAGIQVILLTGDNTATAAAIAREAGINEYHAEASPQEKAEFVAALQKQGRIVAMVGDGINDSPALTVADVGIAMGSGTDIALDSADVTLTSSDLKNILKLIGLSKATVRIVRQNLFWAFLYNVIGIPIAAGILYPFTGMVLDPMFAGATMALSSISVVTNSLRLKWVAI